MLNLPRSYYVLVALAALSLGNVSAVSQAAEDVGVSAVPDTFSPAPRTPGYAAVAVDGRGAWGASLGRSTRGDAGADAVRRCGGNCRVVMTGGGRCVAFADSSSSGYWYGHAYGNDNEAVRRIAMQGCSAGAPRGTCRVKHVNCI